VLDARRNRLRAGERIISEDRSRVKIMVIPTNEELMIARDVEKIVDELRHAEERREEVEETLV